MNNNRLGVGYKLVTLIRTTCAENGIHRVSNQPTATMGDEKVQLLDPSIDLVENTHSTLGPSASITRQAFLENARQSLSSETSSVRISMTPTLG